MFSEGDYSLLLSMHERESSLLSCKINEESALFYYLSFPWEVEFLSVQSEDFLEFYLKEN